MIVGVAKVTNRMPRFGSNRSIAFNRPIWPTCARSCTGSPRRRNRVAHRRAANEMRSPAGRGAPDLGVGELDEPGVGDIAGAISRRSMPGAVTFGPSRRGPRPGRCGAHIAECRDVCGDGGRTLDGSVTLTSWAGVLAHGVVVRAGARPARHTPDTQPVHPPNHTARTTPPSVRPRPVAGVAPRHIVGMDTQWNTPQTPFRCLPPSAGWFCRRWGTTARRTVGDGDRTRAAELPDLG